MSAIGHHCYACDGRGQDLSEDYDEEGGSRVILVRCEMCLGYGDVTRCEGCSEQMALPIAEAGNGFCDGCRADAEQGDDAAERLRITRVA